MLKNVKCPVIIFHGTEDEVVYFGSSEKLKKLLKEKDRFIPIQGGHHNDLEDFELYRQELTGILENSE